MKYLALIGLLAVALACGGKGEKSPPVAPAAGPGRVVPADGVPIAYTVSGSGSPSLVFIHGWMCDQTFWAAQVEGFSASNRVVTIDLPGHGLSGTERQDWSVGALGGDVQVVVEHLDLDEVALIGHSLGGPVALEAARLMPGRVIGVVAVDALHDADFAYEPEQINAYLAAYEADFTATCGQFSRSMFRAGAEPALVERVTNDLCDAPPEIAIAVLRASFDYEPGPALAAVKVPVRCINADMWPTNVEGNRKYHPDFDAEIMEGVGHFLMMEAPEEFNRRLSEILSNLDNPAH